MSPMSLRRHTTIDEPRDDGSGHGDGEPEPGSAQRFSLLDRPTPAWARLRVVTIEPGEAVPFVEDEWRDALVVIEQGAVELVCMRGGRRRFTNGAVLWLFGEPLRLLHNAGTERVVIAAIWRTAHRSS